MAWKHRKFWKHQVLSPEELKVGMIVTKVYSHIKDRSDTFKITELGLVGKGVDDFYLTCVDKDGFKSHHFYGDSNLRPYKLGWNETNYIRYSTAKEVLEFGEDKIIIPKQKIIDKLLEEHKHKLENPKTTYKWITGEDIMEEKKTYEIVPGKRFKLKDLIGEASDDEFWAFCIYLKTNSYSPVDNLLIPEIVDYAQDPVRYCFFDWMVENGHVTVTEPELEEYMVGDHFKKDGNLYILSAFSHRKYTLTNIKAGTFWGEAVEASKPLNENNFPLVKRGEFKRVNLRIDEIGVEEVTIDWVEDNG